MKAVVYDRYGGPDRLRIEETATPSPGPGEVLIEVKSAGLNSYDWRNLNAKPWPVRAMGQGLFRPKNRILGSDVAGVVKAVGDGVDSFRPGNAVLACLEGNGAGGLAAGGLAQFVVAKPGGLAMIPAGLSFDQAAAIPMAGGTALTAVDLVANRPMGKLRGITKPGGVIAVVGFWSLRRLAGVGLAGLRKKAPKRVVMVITDNKNAAYLRTLGQMVAAGQITPVLDQSYPFSQVKEAFTHLGSYHAGGKITVQVGTA